MIRRTGGRASSVARGGRRRDDVLGRAPEGQPAQQPRTAAQVEDERDRRGRQDGHAGDRRDGVSTLPATADERVEGERRRTRAGVPTRSRARPRGPRRAGAPGEPHRGAALGVGPRPAPLEAGRAPRRSPSRPSTGDLRTSPRRRPPGPRPRRPPAIACRTDGGAAPSPESRARPSSCAPGEVTPRELVELYLERIDAARSPAQRVSHRLSATARWPRPTRRRRG